jgi:diguanylate cyclase (GGDEF)-like protein/PAS domain S-box-containing protein
LSRADSSPRPSTLSGLARALLPGSIVARTTLSIIVLATLVGTLVASAGAWMILRSEQDHMRARLDQLLATVESTASVACFVRDEALAREIANGLMSNRVISGVRIVSESGVLNEQSRPGAAPRSSAQTLSISRKVRSPFNPSEVVGEIWLYADQADIQAQAWVYTRFVVMVLAFEVVMVALGVAWVVFNLVTRPVRGISDELHRLEVRTGVRLRVPHGNERDEIGRLVGDVNQLIATLTTLLDTEHRLHMERKASERRLALIFEKVDAGIFEVDTDGLLHSWNPAFVRTLGKPPDPPSLRVMMSGQAQRLNDLINQSLTSDAPCGADFELNVEQRQGTAKWVELSLTLVADHRLQGVVNDITERKRAELAAEQLAERDALTGLLNRRGMDLGLAAAFERRLREPGLGIAVLQLDLDYFKQVNDRYGHEAGDTVLRHVATVLKGAVRHTDLVARPGGDEFTLVLMGPDSVDKPRAIAQNIIDTLRQPIDIGGGAQASIGASIGIALVGGAGESPATVLHRADEAMYAAKAAGRNRAHFASHPEHRAVEQNPPPAEGARH